MRRVSWEGRARGVGILVFGGSGLMFFAEVRKEILVKALFVE